MHSQARMPARASQLQLRSVPERYPQAAGHPVLQASLEYAARCWVVFPVVGEVPHMGTIRFLDATAEPEPKGLGDG